MEQSKRITEAPLVSVISLAYNHEKYIRQCLNGFIMQKTDFPFEVLVHDDASTDGTAEIIREYEGKYPNIFKPIYQTENQYSKGKGIEKFILPKVQGKYIAFCEGDDYWTDPLKLQKQFELLEKNNDIRACYHKVQHISEDDVLLNRYYPEHEHSTGELSTDDLLNGYFHLCSFFIRTSDYIEFKNAAFSSLASGGDRSILWFLAQLKGTTYYLNEVMAHYRWGSQMGWTERIRQDRKYFEACIYSDIASLEAYNQYTDKFTKIVNAMILRCQILIYGLNHDPNIVRKSRYKRSFLKLSKHSKMMFLSAFIPFARKFYDCFENS